ncbi:MAG: glycosyltransferase family 4 protein [Candidatus Firestonebacteria bacterium]
MARKKLLHIVTRLEKGGTLSNILSLMEALSKDFEVVLAVGSFKTEKEKVEKSASTSGYRIVWLEDFRRNISPVKDLITLMDLIDLVLRENPDIVHTHTSKAGILGRAACAITGFKNTVHTPHGHVFYGYFNPVVSFIFVLLERAAAYFTKKIIVFSNAEKKDHLDRNIGRESQFKVIPNGVNPEPYLKEYDITAKKKELEISQDKKVVGFAGRLEPVKGANLFVKAVRALNKERSDFTAVMAGTGYLEEFIKDYAKEEIEKGALKMLGYREDLPEILAVIDIFVVPSKNEGFCLAAVEAGLSKKPVIAARVGGLPEIVTDKETGLLVAPENVETLCLSIKKLLDDQGGAGRLGENGRKKALEYYSEKKMIDGLRKLYEDI